MVKVSLFLKFFEDETIPKRRFFSFSSIINFYLGKSTLINVFGQYLINQGHKIAVLTVDPSSSTTGGISIELD